ncbi:MAG: mechanosensitive ion channel family protein [Thermodesulfovibrionales bacterium]|nr:mechanosensitive ion channel family protein [Thermodesulfovibrionales bacterium]MDP3110541.1 mechanosensitive ion channel family protein [Thermodesulfovibrionales bacterium]
MDINIKSALIPSAVALISIFALFIIRSISFKLLHRWAEKTETKLDDTIIKAFKSPSVYWCVAIGLYIGVAISDISEKYVFYLTKIIHIIVIFSITIASANLAGKLFRDYIKKSSLPIPTTGLAYGILKGTILIIGLLIILSVIGISITPLITALGVGGLAVALALQDTLANLFAGIHILVEKSIRVGDFIRLETGQEGYVDDITWRTTRIRMLPNNMVVIPNSKLSQSIVTNYYLPEKRMSLLIPIGVSYSSDPEKVEKILVEEAKEAVGKIPGLLGDPEPFVRFIPGFGDSSLDFTLICQVQEFVDQYLVQHELRKRIFKRFKEEGIEIPFPHRTVYLREEKDWKR